MTVLYVGLNIDPLQQTQRLERARGRIMPPNVYSVFVDLRNNQNAEDDLNQMFGETRFSELWFNNVFGEMESPIHYRDNPSINPDGLSYRGSTDLRSKIESLILASKLLEPGGRLIINEYMTPDVKDVLFVAKRAALILRSAGFDTNTIRDFIYPHTHKYGTVKAYKLTAIKL